MNFIQERRTILEFGTHLSFNEADRFPVFFFDCITSILHSFYNFWIIESEIDHFNTNAEVVYCLKASMRTLVKLVWYFFIYIDPQLRQLWQRVTCVEMVRQEALPLPPCYVKLSGVICRSYCLDVPINELQRLSSQFIFCSKECVEVHEGSNTSDEKTEDFSVCKVFTRDYARQLHIELCVSSAASSCSWCWKFDVIYSESAGPLTTAIVCKSLANGSALGTHLLGAIGQACFFLSEPCFMAVGLVCELIWEYS